MMTMPIVLAKGTQPAQEVENNKVLKIFSDRAFLPPGKPHFFILYPFWGKNPEDARDPRNGRFDRYLASGHSFFELTDLKRADIAVLPAAWEHYHDSKETRQLAAEFVERVADQGKRAVVFFWHDSTEPLPFGENVIVFRTSFYRSKRKHNEFAMPAWSEDFLQRYLNNQLPLRNKMEIPVIGFCGAAPAPPASPHSLTGKSKKMIKKFLLGEDTARFLRKQAIELLNKSALVKTNFIIREEFLAGALRADGTLDFDVLSSVRKDFVQNLVESDYGLCVRGSGNFSYRLYETLSCGRIPVFVDTDCVLPYEYDIKWHNYLVWVSEKKLRQIPERIKEFHDGLSNDEFVQLQRSCREMWETYLAPEGFFRNFRRSLTYPAG